MRYSTLVFIIAATIMPFFIIIVALQDTFMTVVFFGWEFLIIIIGCLMRQAENRHINWLVNRNNFDD